MLLRVLLILTKRVLVLAYILVLVLFEEEEQQQKIAFYTTRRVFTNDPWGRKNIVVEHDYVQEKIYNRYYVLHQSGSQSVSVWLIFLEHDLWVCPPDMIKLITLPFLRMFAWVGG
jgi:hypothetical protein